jgi:hypothetical protein
MAPEQAKGHAKQFGPAIDPAKRPGATIRLAESLINEGVIHWNQDDNSRAEDRFRRDEKLMDAMRWLKSEEEGGFFNKPGAREHANEDPDLAILAGRKEFRRFVEPPQVKH